MSTLNAYDVKTSCKNVQSLSATWKPSHCARREVLLARGSTLTFIFSTVCHVKERLIDDLRYAMTFYWPLVPPRWYHNTLRFLFLLSQILRVLVTLRLSVCRLSSCLQAFVFVSSLRVRLAFNSTKHAISLSIAESANIISEQRADGRIGLQYRAKKTSILGRCTRKAYR